MKLEQRKVCPFCVEGAPIDVKRSQGSIEEYWCECLGCRARGPREDTKHAAIESWNRGQRPYRKVAAILQLVPRAR